MLSYNKITKRFFLLSLCCKSLEQYIQLIQYLFFVKIFFINFIESCTDYICTQIILYFPKAVPIKPISEIYGLAQPLGQPVIRIFIPSFSIYVLQVMLQFLLLTKANIFALLQVQARQVFNATHAIAFFLTGDALFVNLITPYLSKFPLQIFFFLFISPIIKFGCM